MKMYIWVDPYAVSYGSSLCVVVANNLREARKMAKNAKRFSYGKYEQPAGGDIELGEPDRVLDCPNGEWHEWSE